MSDAVHSPNHYQRGGIECKDVMKAMLAGTKVPGIVAFWWATAFKYLWRWTAKNGVQDLEKCRECLDNMIAEAKAAGMR
jgi:hypothetical protein